MLPHAYPFALLDRLADGGIGVLVTAGAAQLRGGGELPASLAVEVMAQAALVALAPEAGEGGGTAQQGGGLLAGLDTVSFHAPLRAGDLLRAEATLVGRMGPLVKVRCELRRDGELVVEGGLLLALTS